MCRWGCRPAYRAYDRAVWAPRQGPLHGSTRCVSPALPACSLQNLDFSLYAVQTRTGHTFKGALAYFHLNQEMMPGTSQTSDELTAHHEPRSAFLCVAGTKALSMLPAGAAIKWNHRRGQVVWHDAHGRPIRLFCLSSHVCRPVGRLADRLGRATPWRARGRDSGVERLARRSTQAGLLQ